MGKGNWFMVPPNDGGSATLVNIVNLVNMVNWLSYDLDPRLRHSRMDLEFVFFLPEAKKVAPL